MDNLELRKLIEQLHSEIENAQSVDEKGRQLLLQLDKDIRDLLAQNEDGQAGAGPALLQSLRDGVEQFEATHPALTGLLARLLEAISNAGI
jgi:hypothetical protein